jgi:hypothetical protein
VPIDRALRDELLAMLGPGSPVDEEGRRDRLWAILDDYERWPGRSLVGDDAAEAAWLIAQYAVFDPGLQRRCLDLLEVAVATDDAPAAHYACLYDRVRMADGRDQLYGSQFVIDDDGEIAPWPIEAVEQVDERRARVGLVPMAEHTAAMRVLARDRASRPGDRQTQ